MDKSFQRRLVAQLEPPLIGGRHLRGEVANQYLMQYATVPNPHVSSPWYHDFDALS